MFQMLKRTQNLNYHMSKIPIIKAKDFFKYITKFGCTEISIRGSHHKIKNNKNGRVSVVAIHSGEDLYPPMFQAIIKQLDIDINEFINFINKK